MTFIRHLSTTSFPENSIVNSLRPAPANPTIQDSRYCPLLKDLRVPDKPVPFFFRKPFGRLALTAHLDLPKNESTFTAFSRDSISFAKYAKYHMGSGKDSKKIQDLHIAGNFWAVFHHYISQCGVAAPTAEKVFTDPDVTALHTFANTTRSNAFKFIQSCFIQPALAGLDNRAILVPRPVSTVLDSVITLDLFCDAAIAALKKSHKQKDVVDVIHSWLTEATEKPIQKRRHNTDPSFNKLLLESVLETTDLEKVKQKVGGFGAFVSQAAAVFGGHVICGMDPTSTPQSLFKLCKSPFTVIDPFGVDNAFQPGKTDLGNQDLVGNLVVDAPEHQEIPSNLQVLANLAGCSDKTIRNLGELRDTSTVFKNGSNKVPSREEAEAFIFRSKTSSFALLTGIQNTTTLALSSYYINQLSGIECPAFIDFTSPPKETAVDPGVSAAMFKGIRNNAHKIELISFNVTDSGDLLYRLNEAVESDTELGALVDTQQLKELIAQFGQNYGTVQDGEHPEYVFKLCTFLTDFFECPIRARARSIDIMGFPYILSAEEVTFLQYVINGSRQLGVLKAFNANGFPSTQEELTHFGIEVHPRNLAGPYVLLDSLQQTNQISIQDSIAQNLSWLCRRPGRNFVSVVSGITDEFMEDSPSKISVGDFIGMVTAMLFENPTIGQADRLPIREKKFFKRWQKELLKD